MKQRLSVLLVHDNPDDVGFTVPHLPRAALSTCEIRSASGLAGALSELNQGDLDVILLDLGLSCNEGLDTLRELARFAPHVLVVVLTRSEDEAVGEAALREGAEDYLVKESLTGELLLKILRFIGASERPCVDRNASLRQPSTVSPTTLPSSMRRERY